MNKTATIGVKKSMLMKASMVGMCEFRAAPKMILNMSPGIQDQFELSSSKSS